MKAVESIMEDVAGEVLLGSFVLYNKIIFMEFKKIRVVNIKFRY